MVEWGGEMAELGGAMAEWGGEMAWLGDEMAVSCCSRSALAGTFYWILS